MANSLCGAVYVSQPETFSDKDSFSVVTTCAASLTLNNLRSANTVHLCVLCESENKQRLFPYTTLTGLCNRDGTCLLRGTDWVFIIGVNFSL